MKTEQIYLPDIIGKGYASFWNDKHRYRVLKGGRGSKKSTTQALWLIYNLMKYPLANALVVRKTGNTHKDSTFAQLKWAAKKLGVYDKWDFILNPLECRYKATGQKILFRGFDDPLKLTSMTVDTGVLCWVWLEEAYEIDNEQDFNTLDESIRGEMPQGLWKQLTLTFNPWVNSHWTKSRFFDKQDPNAFALTTTYKCNEFLDEQDKANIEALQFTNPDRFKVVGLGDYGIPGGVYFDEYRTDVHEIEAFPIPEHWRRYRVFDYGLDMLACYWVAIDTYGISYIYKEIYESGLIVSEATRKIKEFTTEAIYQTIAPPDLRNRQKDTGKSIEDLFRENGIVLTIANNDRVQGWMNVKEQLKVYDTLNEAGEPIKATKLYIVKKACPNLCRTLPQIQCDPKDVNDTADQPHELTHAPDAVRYFCASRAKPFEEKPTPKRPRNDINSFIKKGRR